MDRAELLEVVRSTIQGSPGLTGAELKKELPRPVQRHYEEALALARELASRGEVHGWTKGKKQRFFSADPIEAVEKVALSLLAHAPATQKELEGAIKREAPALADVFPEWWKAAVARGLVFPQLATAAKTKVFGLKPDARLVLKTPLAALQKAVAKAERQGLGKAEVAAAILEALGLPRAAAAARAHDEQHPTDGSARSNGPDDRRTERAEFLRALRELSARNPSGALLLVPELRKSLGWSKERFDAIALELVRDATIDLHYHDNPTALPERERSELVTDERGNHYVGIAFRRST